MSDVASDDLPESAFDAIVIVGGLHHVSRHLDAVIANLHRSLRPGGVFVMMEPNRDYALELVRRIWYRFDRYFDADDEAALSYRDLRAGYSHLFEERRVRHLGGPAYFLIMMSMVFRIPLGLKRYIAPPLMQIERAWNAIPFRQAHAVFAAQWTKR